MESHRIRKILEKYFEGQSTLDEERELKKYFTRNKDIPTDLIYSKEIFTHFVSDRKKYYPIRRRIGNRFAIAAGIFIVAGILAIFIFYNQNIENSSASLIFQRNETGKVQKITLSNRDIIWLNKNCEVSYPKRIKEDHNKITLNGEAFFELNNNKNTYEIIANNTLLKTEKSSSFNVRAREDMPSTEITVESGTVKVHEAMNPKGVEILVRAGYYCSVHKSQKFVFTSAMGNENYKSWKTGEFKFDNSPMATVANILSEYYNINIEFENKQIAYCQFSGNFKKESLSHILNNIQSQLNFKVTSTGDVIRLSGENCF